MEDRNIRLAGRRDRRLRTRRRDRDEDDRSEHGRAGRVGPDGQGPRRWLQAARARGRLDPEHEARHGRPCLCYSDHRGRPRDFRSRERPTRPLAAGAGQRRPDREGRTRGARRVRHPRRQGSRRGQDRPGPGQGRRDPEGASRAVRRRVRRRQRGRRHQHRLRKRSREGRAVLAPDHADHPHRRVRRSRGGRNPAVARAHRRVRDVRARRSAEPRAADRARGVRDGASDRARRRRRLLDVLPPPGARGACRRAERARCDRGRGSDIRPLRARLRA